MMNNNDSTQAVKQPVPLSEKVTKDGDGCVDAAALERANAVMSELSGDYLEWVQDDIDRIYTSLNELKNNTEAPLDSLNKIFKVAHEMKGQGGCFGYGLITRLGNDLCRFIEGVKNLNSRDIKIIELYIDAMKVIISSRMSGDENQEGLSVVEGLGSVVAKLTN